jgi:hypothetical protein
MEPSGNGRERHNFGARGANFGVRHARRKADGARRKADRAILGWWAPAARRTVPSSEWLMHAGVWKADSPVLASLRGEPLTLPTLSLPSSLPP